MNASMKTRLEPSAYSLIRMSTRGLVDDTKHYRIAVPLRAATATIAECLAAKAVAL